MEKYGETLRVMAKDKTVDLKEDRTRFVQMMIISWSPRQVLRLLISKKLSGSMSCQSKGRCLPQMAPYFMVLQDTPLLSITENMDPRLNPEVERRGGFFCMFLQG